jgi:hypothetical protein
MATYYAYIDTFDDSGIKFITVSVPSQVQRGDTVIFNYWQAEGFNTTVSVSGLNSNVWTNAANFNITLNQSVTRTIRSDASLVGDVISFSASGYSTVTGTITVIVANDTTPNQFTFTDVTEAALNQTITSAPITISGINTSVTASISGNSAEFNINGNVFNSLNKTVNNGDVIRIRMNSSSSYNSTVNTTLSVSTVSDIWSITTIANDITPDQFTFADITQANPSEERFSSLINITGISTPVTASISGNSAQFNVNEGAYSTANKTVNNGDTIQVKMNASSSYNTTVSTTLSVSTVSDVWSITTRTDPGSGQIINFPLTAPTIKQSDVILFYGGIQPLFRDQNLRAYLKGGTYVPNISQNANIPTSGDLRLTNFLGSATALYFISSGSAQSVFANTVSAPQTRSLSWIVGRGESYDPSLGYGNIRFSCEYYWTLAEDTSLDTGLSLPAGAGTWSSNNLGVTLTASAPQNSERTYAGVLTLFVRSSYDTSKVISTTLGYGFFFFGP